MRTEMNNKYFIKLILILACVAPVISLAEEDKSPAEIDSNASVQTEEQPQTINPEKKPAPRQESTKKSKSATRFKPSEEISEDYSVPFPVDI